MAWLKKMAANAQNVAQAAVQKVANKIEARGDEDWVEPPDGKFLLGTLHVLVHEARNLINTDNERFSGKTDPYVRISADGKKGPRTTTIRNNLDPKWEEEIYFHISWKVDTIIFKVKDDDAGLFSQSVGEVRMPVSDILEGKVKESWFPIGKQGELKLTAWWLDANVQTAATEVPSAFKETQGNRVTLYQDAHVPDDTFIPDVAVDGGVYHKHNCLWQEVYHRLEEAQHFIYIAGWSVWSAVHLVREGPHAAGTLSLGELLKKKADEGVTVLVLVWNELMSMDSKAINKLLATTQTGLLNTHDEETSNFFENSKVLCKLALRHGWGVSTLGNITALTSVLGFTAKEAVFTHHQKTVVCDAPSHVADKRRLVAFLGGLDLTSGRYDTQHHPLFHTLGTLHHGDYYQGYGAYDATLGPRQPWHDVHAFLEGPIVYDVVANFEQRWRRQAVRHVDRLVDLATLPLLSIEEQQSTEPGSWNCQLFRSIDNFSAVLPEPGVERSIQEAYIHHIRRAQRFIYIENQYFLGSSQEWQGFDENKWNVECKHRVPAELAAKVVAKIRAGERFAIYIVIPMHPEGAPEDPAIAAILHWQYKTVQFMYDHIAKALEECGPEGAVPTDYLNFYFPGQREPGPVPPIPANCNKRQANQLVSRRHMIYVHCKLMIVDDEYLIMGSANINERSMAGDRDTEICVGAHQPDFKVLDGALPRGQVAGYRLSLWGEHTGVCEEVFYAPDSLDCVRRMNAIAENNWTVYAGDEVRPMPSHLCKYPYAIAANGALEPVQRCFPDMEELNSTIIGAPQATVPNLLTT